ncbi:polymer-forming cytoskeletal protein [Altererythrobacter aerius]|uniref:Polymer-forming cytoskeletal protein n=1 Tax=Tsuneonella aeria TaxID=1837929 RepID=A0A6I4THF5_9SPHN|nr:polymer-forming cytoskeletal protein [Tsuneonella aeria]
MFTKKPDANGASLHVAKPASVGSFSVIGSDVVITGDVSASADLHVDGRIEGDIRCASLVQGEGSHIEGAVSAESARLAGSVSGSISARELVILKTARIHGDVHYDALTIEQGADVEGRLAHRTPAEPARMGDGEPKLTLAS